MLRTFFSLAAKADATHRITLLPSRRRLTLRVRMRTPEWGFSMMLVVVSVSAARIQPQIHQVSSNEVTAAAFSDASSTIPSTACCVQRPRLRRL